MLKIHKISAFALLVGAVASNLAFADAKSDAKFAEDSSYALGVMIGSDLKGLMETQKGVINYNNAEVLKGVSDVLNDQMKLSKEEIVNRLQAMDDKLKVAREAQAKEQAKKAKAEGEKFSAEFAKKAGVKTTKSGLLYLIDKAGEGDVVKPTDVVKVHYTGKLPDGTVFDSSRKNGQPIEFQLNQLIPGWVEGIQLIKKGGHIELVVPPALGYGEQDNGVIPPNSTLYFDIELLDVKAEKK